MNTSFTPPANATLRRITATCLSAALLIFTSLQSMAQVIPATPLCSSAQTVEFSNSTPTAVVDDGVMTSTIVVSGASSYLLDLNVITQITHTFPGDLDITLTSPAGTIVTLTTDNAGDNDDVFNGTLWDDDADPDGLVPYTNNNGLVTDHLYALSTLASPLVPEEAFGAFIGEDPNGTWTLTVSDDAAVDGGSLNVWALQVTGLQSAPPTFFDSFSDAPALAIADNGVVSSTITVSGLHPYLFDLNVITNITHTFPGDLDITLTSPAGTVVTLTTDNGGDNDDVFAGTTWDDDADPDGLVPYTSNDGLVTDQVYVLSTVVPALVPEEALAAFIGEDPNGVWTITISDDASVDGGTLNSWQLDITQVGDETAPAITCPSDITQSNDAGFCDAVVNYTAPVGTDNCEVVTLTQSYDNSTVTFGNSVSCNGGSPGFFHTDNSYYRVYDLPSLGYTSDFFVHSVNFGVEEAVGAGGSQPVVVNIYTLSGPFLTANLTLIASEVVTVADQVTSIINAPIEATIPAGSTLVVELFSPDGQVAGNSFFMGSNANGESGSSYIMAADCGISTPTTFAAIGFPGTNIILDVNAGSLTTLTSGLGSGATFAISGSPYTETYTVTDLSGNSTSCSFTITVEDNENPVITSCPADATADNAPGTCGAVVTYPSATATDNCPGTTLSYSQASGTVFDVGVTTVTVTATDGAGNTTTCSFTVTVSDTTNPVITCPSDLTVSNDAGQCSAVVTFSNPTATDNCLGAPTSDFFNFTGAEQTFVVPAGVTSVTIEAYGAQGGNGSATGGLGGYATGTLAVTPGQTLYIYTGGQGNAFNGGMPGGNGGSGIGGGASDVRAGGNTTADRVLVAGGGGGGGGVGCDAVYPGGNGGDGGGDAGADGTNSPDGGGGFGGTVGVGGAAGIGCAGFLGDPGLADGTGGAGQSCCCFGNYTIPGGGGGGGGYAVGGGGGGGSAGNTGCSGNNKGGGGGGAGGTSYVGGVSGGTTTNGLQAGDGLVVITYLAGGTTVAQTGGLTSGSVFPVGSSTVTFTATDAAGNSSSCSYNVIVEDNENPTICVPGLVNVTSISYTDLTGPSFDVMSGGALTGRPFSDGTCCSGLGPVPTEIFEFSVDVTGTYNINQTQAYDGYLLLYTDPFNVNVNPPTTFVAGNDDGGGGIGTSDLTAVSLTAGQNYYLISTAFENEIDGVYGSSTTTFAGPGNVQTLGTGCQGDVTIANEPGVCEAIFNYTAPVGNDNCPGAVTTLTGGLGSGASFPVGVTTEEYTVTDAAGNTATYSFNVTVEDTEAPVITTCPADVAVDNETGTCGATVTFDDAVATDNCAGPITYTYSTPNGSVFYIGTTTVTATATDAAGNSSTCTFTVTVSDVEEPVLACPDVTVSNDAGLCSAVVNYTEPVGVDNCNPYVLTQSLTQAITPLNSVSCNNGFGHTDNSYMRVFDLTAMGFTNDFYINSVDVAIEDAIAGIGGTQPATLNLYSLTGPLTFANLTLLATEAVTVADQSGTILNIPLTSQLTVPAGTTLVVEFFTPDGQVDGNLIFVGSNPDGATGASYLAAAGCGIPEPTDVALIGFPDMNIVMNVNAGVLTEFVSGIGTGGTFPVGSSPEVYQATDIFGNVGTCTFNVIVNDVEVPTITCLSDPPVTDTYASSNVPVAVIDEGTVTSTLTISDHGAITDLNVLNLAGTHTWVSDLTITLTSPGGTTVELFSATCGSGDDYNINFDDAGLANASWPCNPVGGGGTYVPNGALSAFNGEDIFGTWTITVSDAFAGDVGNLNSWSLETSVAGSPHTYYQSNDAGQCGANVTVDVPTYSDNCVLTLTNSFNGTADASDFYPVGITTVTWTVTDPSGNTASCDVIVNVTDDEDPVITCPSDIFADNDAGQCGAVVTYALPVVSDNCPIPAIAAFTGASLPIPDDDPAGASVSQTVSGLIGTQLGTDVFLQSVCLDVSHTWVGDLQFVLVSPNGDVITLMDEPGCSGNDLDVCFVPGTGNELFAGTCSTLPAYSGDFSAESGDLGALSAGTDPNGVWTLYATDWAGGDIGTVNSWSLTFLDQNGVPSPVLVSGLASGSEFPVGTTTNTYEVTDASGNTVSCSFDVVISDIEGPALTCPADITVSNDAGICGAVVNYTPPVGVDNCDPFTVTHSLTQNVPSGNGIACNTGGLVNANRLARVFDINAFGFTNGMHITGVQFGIDDAAAGIGGVQPVTVNLYTLSGPMSIANLTLVASQAVSIPDQTGTIMTVPIVADIPAGSILVYEVNIPDGVSAGNTLFIGANDDGQTGPSWIASAPCGANDFADLALLGLPNTGFVMNVLAGAVTVQTDVTGLTAGDEFPIGTTVQEYTSTDVYGNSTTCSFNVTVNDTEAPVFSVCPSDTIGCESSPVIVFATPTASDNCPGMTLTQTAGLPSGSTFPAGVTTNTFTATDAAGNVTTCSFDVTITPNPVVDFTYFPTCIGEIIYFTSAATVNPVLGTTIVSYEWEFSDGSGTNLDVNPTHVYNVAGDYDVTLTVTTNYGCQTSVTHTVTVHPTPTFTLTPQDALCNGDANGTITVDVTVGDAPIDYSINGGPAQSSNVFTGLAAGNYLISITDANGCSASSSVTVGEPDELVGSVVSTTDVVCFGQASGGAEVTATGGTAPYSYAVDGGSSQGSGVFSGLTGGAHTVTITDDNGCTATVTVTVGEPDEIVVNATSQPVLCNGDATGSIDVTASGGVGALQYSADGGTTFQSTGTFSGLGADSYVVVVMDANGCTVSEGVTITEPAQALSGTAVVQNVSCMGGANGTITITGDLGTGTGAHQYSIDGGTTWQSGNTFSDLAAGDYTITVMDANGCTTTVDATVVEPATALALNTAVTNVTCNGAGDGQIDATGAGGDAPYEYSFNGGTTWQASGSFTNLLPGTYTVMLRDSNMCAVASTVVVTQPAVLTVTETASADASCDGQANGSFTVTAAGGTAPYTYTSNGNSNSTGVFTNVAPGIYMVVVNDDNFNCLANVLVEVGFTNPLPVAAFNWFASGTVVQFSNQSVDGVSYAWDFGDGATSTDQNPVHTYASGGTYTVTLVVTNACGTDTITWVIDTNHIGIDDPDGDANALTVYPNPNHGQFTLNYTSTGIIGQIQVNILTVEGRLVMAEQFTINADTFIRNYSDIELAAGVYMVQFISEKSSVVKRITVDK